MESQIHHLEQEAYGAVLRAFKAQSDALTWEKEGLITELRKELRVSDDEHRDLLTKVNTDDIICRIREWRKAGGNPSGIHLSQANHDAPSPTFSASRKKQKTSQSLSLPFGMPSQAFHTQSIATTQPSPSAVKWAPVQGFGGRKHRPGSPMKSTRYPSTGPTPRGLLSNHGSSALESTEAATRDPLIGRKVMTRWPDDNNFYEASIIDYNPAEGRHALVYDKNTLNETWEWINLKEIPAEDIRWVDEDPGIYRQSFHGGQGSVANNPTSHGIVPSTGRGKGTAKDQFGKEFQLSRNGVVNRISDEIEILHTETLIKEVEKVFGANQPDLLEIEKAKKMLKEHEQALIDVIAKLADVSDNESDGELPLSEGQSARRGHNAISGREPLTAAYNHQADYIIDV